MRRKPLDLWEPIVIPREEIEDEIDRLANLPQPANGRRRSLFVHPRNKKSQGLAPGIEVALDVLKPGERTVPYRQNSTQVNFVIHGEGISVHRRQALQRGALRRLEYAFDGSPIGTRTPATSCSCG